MNENNNIPDENTQDNKPSGGKHAKKGGRTAIIVISSIVGALLLVVFAGYLVVNSYLSQINYDDGTSGTVVGTPLPDDEDERSDEPDSSQDELDAAEQEINDNLLKELEARENTKDLTNILLIGSDTRKAGQLGRSDTMMLLTIDRDSERIVLTSIMRDIYVHIPGHGNTRINSAYATGGASLLIDTIETNFKVEIDNYAAIDFYAFVDAMDAIGGITMNVTEDEFEGINTAIRKYNKIIGDPTEDAVLTSTGEQLLSGKQALGYARNRKYPDGDFGRTAHQRALLTAIFDEMKGAGLGTIDAVLDAILPGITTDMTQTEILSWMTLAPSLLKYELETYNIPIDGSHTGITVNGASMLSINFKANIEALYEIIYKEPLPAWVEIPAQPVVPETTNDNTSDAAPPPEEEEHTGRGGRG